MLQEWCDPHRTSIESEASLVEGGKDECERHAKTREIVRKCMGISFWWKGLQGEGCGTRGERPCQYIRSKFKKRRNLGDDGSETQVRVGSLGSTGPRLGDRHETSCERDQRNRADICEHRNLDGKLGDCCKSETARIPWRYWSLGAENKFTKHSTLSSGKECRRRRDPNKPDELEERGKHTCHSDTDGKKGTIVCKVTDADVANAAADDSMEVAMSVGSSCGNTCVDKCTEETLRGLGRNDHATKRECLNLCKIWGKVPNTDAVSLDDKRNNFQLIQIIVRLIPIHAKAVLEGRGQGGLFV